MPHRPVPFVHARMPSTRPPSSAPAATRRAPPTAATAAATGAAAATSPADPATPRSGGFHESSYELLTGMDMLETEWPPDTTLPGELDEA